jgi:beta-glucanase (GH16 family)
MASLPEVESNVLSKANKYIDTSTPLAQRKLRSFHGNTEFDLVMSDEFTQDGRSFEPGKDPLFEAVNAPDYTNSAIQFYNWSTDYVTTRNGSLVITTRAEHTVWQEWNETSQSYFWRFKNYTSGMVQSWNKFCFTGGIVEVSLKLPGSYNSSGLWPAFWLMGNLGRAVYTNSTEFIWPWSYDKCDGVGSRQAATQLINACNPSPGYGLHPNQGRGSPEIDILEIMATQWKWGGEYLHTPAYISTSLQVSPGTPWNLQTRPETGWPVWGYMNGSKWQPTHWYDDLHLGVDGVYNEFYGRLCGSSYPSAPDSYVADTISVNTPVNESLWNSFHTYRLEWQPEGYIEWYLDDVFLFGIPQESLTNKTGSLVSVEPMYLIANTAMGTGWGINENCAQEGECMGICDNCMDCHNPKCQCGLPEVTVSLYFITKCTSLFISSLQGMKNCAMFPAEMEIEYIRVYQNKRDEKHTLGCSPPDFPTAGFIEGNKERYENWTPKRSPYEGFGSVEPFEKQDDMTIYSFACASVLVGVLLFIAITCGRYFHTDYLLSFKRFGYSELPPSSAPEY